MTELFFGAETLGDVRNSATDKGPDAAARRRFDAAFTKLLWLFKILQQPQIKKINEQLKISANPTVGEPKPEMFNAGWDPWPL